MRAGDPSALVAHIVEHHHAYARRALPYILPLLAKAAGFHRGRSGNLEALCEAGQALAEALEAQHEEEARRLFPALLAGAPRGEGALGSLESMCRHHLEVGALLSRVRALADGYVAQPWASHGYHALMEELEALEDDVLEHMHLEDFALAAQAGA